MQRHFKHTEPNSIKLQYKYPFSNPFLTGSWGGWPLPQLPSGNTLNTGCITGSRHNDPSNHTHGQFRAICQKNMRTAASIPWTRNLLSVRHSSNHCATNYNQSFSVITQEETASLKSVASSLSLLTNLSGSFLITFPILHQFPFSSARIDGTNSENGTFNKFIAALKTTRVLYHWSTQKSDQKKISQNTSARILDSNK